jgi:hypothetical protein
MGVQLETSNNQKKKFRNEGNLSFCWILKYSLKTYLFCETKISVVSTNIKLLGKAYGNNKSSDSGIETV